MDGACHPFRLFDLLSDRTQVHLDHDRDLKTYTA